MWDNVLMLRAFIRGAKLAATAQSSTLTAILNALILQQFQTTFQNNQILIKTQEAGGMVEFAAPNGLDVVDIVAMAERALSWCEKQTDPENPDLSLLKTVTRLRPDFRGMTL